MPGQIHRLKSLLRALVLYIEARGRLAQIEARETAAASAGILIVSVLVVGALLFAWLLAAPAIVWLIAKSQGWPWPRVALGAAALHLLAAVAAFLNLRSRLRRFKAFDETFNQFQRDREWLSRSADSD